MTPTENNNLEPERTGVIRSSAWLGRVGFTLIPQGSQEEKRIRDAILQLRVQKQIAQSPLRLSECEAARLCECMRRPRYLMAKAQMALPGSGHAYCLLWTARTIQLWDGLWFHLRRTLCIADILRLRFVRRFASFCNVRSVSYFSGVSSSGLTIQAEARRDEGVNHERPKTEPLPPARS